jgi:hypothetical protein
VSSFKTTLLESKVNTLGGKYPFFFRNGNVNYKEFPISGLISAHMDNLNSFIDLNDITPLAESRMDASDANISNSLDMTLTSNLSTGSFYWERQFKMKVLEWL